MSDVASIVQFPHPGAEHRPRGDWMPWNTARHRRKFMAGHGTTVNCHGEVRNETDLTFWGEWEGFSRVVARWAPANELPTVLHEPCWRSPDFDGPRQNTDPWVFGETFLYSNCTQLTPAKRPSALQRLHVGSVILFGSVKAAQFVLDTVFVVGEVVGSYTPLDADQLMVHDVFRIATVDSLKTGPPEDAGATYTLYRGATPTSRVADMFSFVPCLPRTADGPRFARRQVHLRDIINPKSKQTPSGASQVRPLPEVARLWSALVEQIIGAGLELGSAIALPKSCP
jgi:hypothetical protein